MEAALVQADHRELEEYDKGVEEQAAAQPAAG
jgi:hypothetical protein